MLLDVGHTATAAKPVASDICHGVSVSSPHDPRVPKAHASAAAALVQLVSSAGTCSWSSKSSQVDAAYPFSVMSPSCVPKSSAQRFGGGSDARRGSWRVTMTYLQLAVQLGEPRPELSAVVRHGGQRNSALLAVYVLCAVLGS